MKYVPSGRPDRGITSWFFLLVLLLISAGPVAHAAPPAGGPLGVATPVRIATMPGDRLLVSDYDLGVIHIVDRQDLSVERSFSVGGRPVAVAWGLDRIFVGNETLGRVEVYNPRGKRIATFGEPGSIRLPNAIAVDAEGSQVLVLDVFEKVVKVFSSDGILLRRLTQPGALTNPSAMTFDPVRRRVLVSDFGAYADSTFAKQNALVRHFDTDGVELQSFDGVIPNTTTRTFVRPQGLAFDGAGHLYVVDSFASEVHVLDAASGVPIGVLGGFGTDPGLLSLPLDAVFSSTGGKLYVTDSRNGRIATFAQWGTP